MNLLYKRKIVNVYVHLVYKVYKLFLFDLCLKLNNYNYLIFFKFNKVISTIFLGLGLHSEIDIKIINALEILDFFFSKKASINKFKDAYLKQNRTLVVVTNTWVNGWYDIYFLFIIIKRILEPTLGRKFIFFKFTLFSDGFYVNIKDVSFIDIMPDFLKSENLGIKFSFFFSVKYNLYYINLFLRYFGFI